MPVGAYPTCGRLPLGTAHPGEWQRSLHGIRGTRLLVAPAPAGCGTTTSTSDAAVADIETVHLVARLQPAGSVVGGDVAFNARGVAFVTKTVLAGATVPQGPLGNPGTPTVVTRRPRLVGADGLTFDRDGNIWVAVAGPLYPDEVVLPLAGQYLMLLTRAGELWHVTKDAPWMDSPKRTGTRPHGRHSQPDVRAQRVPVRPHCGAGLVPAPVRPDRQPGAAGHG